MIEKQQCNCGRLVFGEPCPKCDAGSKNAEGAGHRRAGRMVSRGREGTDVSKRMEAVRRSFGIGKRYIAEF